jgi:TolA-binding protein
MPMRLAITALLLAGVAAPAFAQPDSAGLPGRVDVLEKEMRAVQRKVFPGANPTYFDPQIAPPTEAPVTTGAPAQSVVSDLTQRVSALEQQMAQLTNQSEVNGHRLDVLEQKLAKMQGDTDFRLNALEGHGAPAPGPDGTPPPQSLMPPTGNAGAAPFGPAGRKPPAVRAPAGDTMAAQAAPDLAPPVDMPPKTGDPAEDGYMAGYTLWTQKRYSDAETRLKEVVAKYPDSRRASYAQNLLGRAYMDDGQLTSAADAFLTSYKRFPHGERAADSLYYLGQTLTRLKKTTQACQVYDELRDVYGPTLSAPLKARAAQGRADAKCGA